MSRVSIFDREDQEFHVVVNHEEQYSIWPSHREPPAGWDRVGEPALKPECLARIEELWTDMRPLSLRRAMEAQEKELAEAAKKTTKKKAKKKKS